MVTDKVNPDRVVRVEDLPVAKIRPEDGLGRKRDRDGHRDLQRSIEQFGVLTPITVRPAPDSSGDFLLIKGQGRTLACRLLGLETIPAVVIEGRDAEEEKVQQFLVENVARLRMASVDRALLIAHARREGEETVEVADRFGVAPATVRRLEAQLDGASSGEVAALRAGEVNLAAHAAIARHVASTERSAVVQRIGGRGLRANEIDALLGAINFRALFDLGPQHHVQRMALLDWAVATLTSLPRSNPRERVRQLAAQLPPRLPNGGATKAAG